VPWRSCKFGYQLNQARRTEAALCVEGAIQAVHRVMNGLHGPRDIFRNPYSLYKHHTPESKNSPFDLVLTKSGDDFSVMDMHFKLGLYHYSSLGAIDALINLIALNKEKLFQDDNISKIDSIKILLCEEEATKLNKYNKSNPLNSRYSAHMSIIYSISTMLRKASEKQDNLLKETQIEELWKYLMLLPHDYKQEAIFSDYVQ